VSRVAARARGVQDARAAELADLARALEVVEYELGALAPGHLPGAHKGAAFGAAGKLAGFTTLLHRMDPRNIDPVTTRRALSPIPLVRLYEARVAIAVVALVDLSASMGFRGCARRMAEAARLVAALAYSAYRWGDRFALVGFADEVELVRPPRRAPEAAWEVGTALWFHEPAGRGWAALDAAIALLPRRRSLVFFVSDFHVDTALVDRALAGLRRHEVVPVVLWDSAEAGNGLGTGWTEWVDPETGAAARRWVRRGYGRRARRTLEERRRALEALFRRHDRTALFVRDRVDPAAVTRFFVSRRA
jgi:uncharacterized protein (DUF58 family)